METTVKKPLPKTLTVLVDTREQNPLVFPSTVTWHHGNVRHLFTVKTATQKLVTGDYALSGFEEATLCERKGSMSELRTNLLTRDRARWEGCLYRLRQSCRHPWILLDISQSERRRVTDYVPEPDKVLDALLLNTTTWGIPVYWIEPGKTPVTVRMTGEFVVRKLWAGVYAHHYQTTLKGDTYGLVGGEVDLGTMVNDRRADAQVPAHGTRV